MANTILLGTRKGLLLLEGKGSSYRVLREAHAGVPVTYAMQDPRDGSLWAALGHGHWGCHLHRSTDMGETWEELATPSYPEGEKVQVAPGSKDCKQAKLESIWMITPGGAEEPGTMWVGTLPGGLFRTDDFGKSFELVRGLWDLPTRLDWFGGGADVPGIHSILVDPRDSKHLHVAVSCAGVLESRDRGESWDYRCKGMRADFMPDPEAPVGQDPHFVMACASHPDVLWQQNHCGIWRTSDGGAEWVEISEEKGPARFGFAVAAHEEKPEVAWVVPAVSDVQRMAVERSLLVCRTEDGGKSWQPLQKGLPTENCWDLVYRHALAITGEELAFGSTTGNVFHTGDGGEGWHCLGSNFPPVYSLRFGKD